jgi:hypothetical protein
MGFASGWLESRTLFPALINEAPHADTGIIVVVPAYDEPLICELLDSLALCQQPSCRTEIIIVVNANLRATSESLKNNLLSLSEIEVWKKKNVKCFFRTFALNLGQPAIKGWGVGHARKAGMDEALRRFNIIDKPEGVIINLDADCTVQDNYFVSVESELLRRKDRKGCSVYFEHPLAGTRFPEIIYSSVYQYELHLRYYYQALSFTGFPDVYHTVGSSIAIKSLPYYKAGGMNRREAGEDFYFVQKMVSAGGYFSLNSTTVYPSPRASERVPFGTGPAVGRMVGNNEKQFLTYNPLAFSDLHAFFGETEKLFDCRMDKLVYCFDSFPDSLKLFFADQEWIAKITEIKKNTSGPGSFRKRFFAWFNMFRIVKYLNFTHKSVFEKVPVMVAAQELLKLKNIDLMKGHESDLLQLYRNLEKSTSRTP